MRRTLLALAAITALLTGPTMAQSPQTKAGVKAAATVAPVAFLSTIWTTSTLHWSTVGTQTWNFPWVHTYIHRFIPIPNPTLPNSWAVQGINTVGQYGSNIADPTYFNEAIHISNPLPGANGQTGTHSTSAQYKQQHSKTSKSLHGELIVGCIMGSAVGLITTSIIKAYQMGNPPRWRSQFEHEQILASGIEKQYELTPEEAQTAAAVCGLGSFVAL